MKMLKFTRAFLLFVMLLAPVQGAYPCCPEIQKALGDLKSDVENLRDIIKDLGTNLRRQFGWLPSQIGL